MKPDDVTPPAEPADSISRDQGSISADGYTPVPSKNDGKLLPQDPASDEGSGEVSPPPFNPLPDLTSKEEHELDQA